MTQLLLLYLASVTSPEQNYIRSHFTLPAPLNFPHIISSPYALTHHHVFLLWW
jgi:hypothetical protein